MASPDVNTPTSNIVAKLINELIPMEQENHPFGLPRTEVKIEDDALRDEKVCQEVKKILTLALNEAMGVKMKLEFKDNSMSVSLHSMPKNDTSSFPQPKEFTFFLAQLTQGRALPIFLDVSYHKERKNEAPIKIVAYINGCSRAPDTSFDHDQKREVTSSEHRLRVSLPQLTMREISLPSTVSMIHHQNNDEFCFVFNVFFPAKDTDVIGSTIKDWRAGNFLTIRMTHELYTENRDMLTVFNERKEYTKLLKDIVSMPHELTTITLTYLTIF